jgi:Fe-S cluster assembly iron-binding protein IscA
MRGYYNRYKIVKKGIVMVTATEAAHKRIGEILKEKKDVPQGVRVYLQEGG